MAVGTLMQEKPGQTLQATALVQEAYIWLVDVEIRFLFTAEHTEEQIRHTVQALADCVAASRGVTPHRIAGKELH